MCSDIFQHDLKASIKRRNISPSILHQQEVKETKNVLQEKLDQCDYCPHPEKSHVMTVTPLVNANCENVFGVISEFHTNITDIQRAKTATSVFKKLVTTF